MIDEFDAVMEQYRRRMAGKRDAALAAVERQAELRADCGKPLLEVTAPVLEEVAAKLNARGHKAGVRSISKPWGSVVLSLEASGQSAQASVLGFDCAAGESVRCTGEVWGPKSDRWADELPMKSLTSARVREVALRFVRDVLDQW